MQGILGAITGSLFGAANIFMQHRQQKQQAELARKQFEAARLQAINEEQARAKYQGKEPDADALVVNNTEESAPTDLTRGRVKRKLLAS